MQGRSGGTLSARGLSLSLCCPLTSPGEGLPTAHHPGWGPHCRPASAPHNSPHRLGPPLPSRFCSLQLTTQARVPTAVPLLLPTTHHTGWGPHCRLASAAGAHGSAPAPGRRKWSSSASRSWQEERKLRSRYGGPSSVVPECSRTQGGKNSRRDLGGRKKVVGMQSAFLL